MIINMGMTSSTHIDAFKENGTYSYHSLNSGTGHRRFSFPKRASHPRGKGLTFFGSKAAGAWRWPSTPCAEFLRMRGATPTLLPAWLHGVHRHNCPVLIFTAVDRRFTPRGSALLYVTRYISLHSDVMFTEVNRLMCWLEVNFTVPLRLAMQQTNSYASLGYRGSVLRSDRYVGLIVSSSSYERLAIYWINESTLAIISFSFHLTLAIISFS